MSPDIALESLSGSPVGACVSDAAISGDETGLAKRSALMATRAARFPGWLLFVAFLVVPLVEIYVIIQVGQVIGAWWTILLLILDSLFGAWLIKHEGGRAWLALNSALRERPDAGQGTRRRGVDPDRRHADADAGFRHRRVRNPADPAVHPAVLPAAADRFVSRRVTTVVGVGSPARPAA